ncbi:AEC family transporter [Clostridium sp. DJ247]|uniref:AEC family transporter n=1 Tax=Clostridium sp. DJ247 TaxID=2726188 RepID=UPI001629A28D|nr:AEC family transporter [Clostridium sp. DJ247]MBC2582023.1 AEC family transporter [Clostridium sp. DJ247]
MKNISSQIILSLIIIALGYLFKRINIIKEKDGEGVSRIIFNVTLPALIINTFNSINIDFSLIMLSLISIIYGIFMSIIALFVFRKEGKSTRGMLSMLVPGFNIGLFAYPLVESIWGQKGLKYFGMFDMGNSLVLFGICYLIASYFSPSESTIDFKNISKKIFTSIPLMSYIITLAVNLSGLHYPSGIIEICAILGRANMPLSLLLLGIYLNFSIDAKYKINIIKILSMRYFIGILVGVLLFVLMPFDSLFRYTLLIGLILPIGMAVIPFSIQFKYDEQFVGTLSNITIIVSFILVWIIVALSTVIK